MKYMTLFVLGLLLLACNQKDEQVKPLDPVTDGSEVTTKETSMDLPIADIDTEWDSDDAKVVC